MRRIWITGGLLLLLMACSDKKPVPGISSPSTAQTSTSTMINLVGTEWRLQDLGGAGIIDNSQATLAFPETERVAGNGSCNRFMGPLTLAGNSIKIGPLAGTRMACVSEAVSNQEMRYMKALEGAIRVEWKDPYLLIYCDGLEKPLRFTKGAGK